MKHKHFLLILFFLTNITCVNAAIIDGACGANLTWTLNTKDSILTIEGTGEMTSTPWTTYNSYIAYASLPEGLTNIGNSAFENSKDLRSIVIPCSVTTIGDRAFYACEKLSSLTIPNNVVSIGDNAFMCCRTITTITIPENVNHIGRQVFTSCTNLKTAIFNNEIKSFGDCAFSNCQNLESVSLPIGLTVISGSTFSDCYKLSSIDIPNTVTTIGGMAFMDCISLASVSIPDSVTSIDYRAFARCTALQSIEIGESVTSLGKAVFEKCTSLTTVIWKAKFCSNFTQDSSPFDFYVVGTYDSQYNYSIGHQITSFVLGEKVRHIPAYLLRATLNLESISIPNSVKSIGKYAFNGSAIHSINIPDSVNSIGEYAFSDCANLSTVILGKSIINIGKHIFRDCPIKNLTVYAETPPEGGLESGISNTTCKLYVPEDYLNVYTNTIWWEDFMDIRPIQDQTTAIENSPSYQRGFNKLFHNGQIFILRGDKTYTLTGQEVK